MAKGEKEYLMIDEPLWIKENLTKTIFSLNEF